MILSKKQTTALDFLEDTETHQLVFGGGAGGGKSVVGVYWIIKSALKYAGTRWLIGRAKLKTLKETTLQSFFEVVKLQGLKVDVHFRYNAQANIISFYNGSEIFLKDLFLYPSDPNFDELGSLEITGAFIDECNQIVYKAWQIVLSRIRYKLDENGLTPKLLGTCNPSKNWVYSDFYKAKRDGTIERKKEFLQSLVMDNPFISLHYEENLKQLDVKTKERLLYGNWEYEDDPARIFNFEKLQNAFTNSFIEKTGEKYISADIALQGSDKFIVCVWQGFILEKIYSIAKCTGKEAEEFLREKAEYHKVPMRNIVYDHDGLGAFLGSYLQGAKSFINNSRALNNENYSNLKSQCYFLLAGKINNDEIFITDSDFKDEIILELEQVKQKNIDMDGKIAVEGKEKMKEALGHSPDFADAIMMRMFFETKKEVYIFKPRIF